MSTAGGSPAVIRGANGVAPSASPKTTTYETIVDRSATSGRQPGCRSGPNSTPGSIPGGVTVTKEEMDALALVRDEFHGEWNYKLLLR